MLVFHDFINVILYVYGLFMLDVFSANEKTLPGGVYSGLC